MIGDWIAWAVSLLFGVLAYLWLVRTYPTYFQRSNFLGHSIPANGGVIILFACEAAYVWLLKERYAQSAVIVQVGLLAAIGFGVLGLIDDIYGDRSIGGLKGHFSTLFKDQRLTTGALKAIGGAVLSLAVGLLLHPGNIALIFLAAALIALCANAVNLTDTRPGRALSVVTVLGVVGAVVGAHNFTLTKLLVLCPPFIIAFVLFFFDRRAKIMIGDCGSNALGAIVGLLWVLVTPTYAQVLLLIILVAFHIWTESHSLSQTIEKSPILRAIDRRVGVRRS